MSQTIPMRRNLRKGLRLTFRKPVPSGSARSPIPGGPGGAEICLGEVDRETVRNLAAGLSETTDFLAGVYGDSYVILSADRFGLAVGLKHFADTVLRSGTVPVSENRRGRLADLPHDAFYRDAVLLARRLFETYGSWLEKQKPTMSDADREDIRLVDVLIRHLGNAVVFRARQKPLRCGTGA